jgi:hypothetical protein
MAEPDAGPPPAAPEQLAELERQLEQGSLFTHTVLSEQIVRSNESEALLHGLIDALVERGIVQPDDVARAAEAARQEADEQHETGSLGVALRVDDDAPADAYTPVNCAERLPTCQAVCCRLRFALSAAEVEDGRMRWELGRPYYNRQLASGCCHQLDPSTKACGIYADRPCVCRRYSCANDPRIWKDFERMELNQEWIDANLQPARPRLLDAFMEPGSPGPGMPEPNG